MSVDSPDVGLILYLDVLAQSAQPDKRPSHVPTFRRCRRTATARFPHSRKLPFNGEKRPEAEVHFASPATRRRYKRSRSRPRNCTDSWTHSASATSKIAADRNLPQGKARPHGNPLRPARARTCQASAACSETSLVPCATHCLPSSRKPNLSWNRCDAGLGG